MNAPGKKRDAFDAPRPGRPAPRQCPPRPAALRTVCRRPAGELPAPGPASTPTKGRPSALAAPDASPAATSAVIVMRVVRLIWLLLPARYHPHYGPALARGPGRLTRSSAWAWSQGSRSIPAVIPALSQGSSVPTDTSGATTRLAAVSLARYSNVAGLEAAGGGLSAAGMLRAGDRRPRPARYALRSPRPGSPAASPATGIAASAPRTPARSAPIRM